MSPVSPALAENLAAEVVGLYQEAERQLLERISRNLAKGIGGPHWAEEKYAQLLAYQKQTERLIADLAKKAKTGVDTAITTAYERGGLSAVADIAKLPGFHDLTVQITRDIEHADQAFLGLIKTPQELRGQGLASKALSEVTGLADRNSVTTRLLVIPEQHPGDELSTKELKAWYARHGFIRDAGDPDLMVRYPENPVKGKAPPKTNYGAFEKGVAELSARSAVSAEPLAGLRAVEAMAQETLGYVSSTHPRILRSTMDAYRSVIADASQPVLLGAQTRRQAAQAALDAFAKKGITGFIDKSGRGWNLESYVETAMRTGCGKAAVQGHVDRLTENGLDLVIVSDAPRECPLCRPWEGKVLSIGGVPVEMPEGTDPAFHVAPETTNQDDYDWRLPSNYSPLNKLPTELPSIVSDLDVLAQKLGPLSVPTPIGPLKTTVYRAGDIDQKFVFLADKAEGAEKYAGLSEHGSAVAYELDAQNVLAIEDWGQLFGHYGATGSTWEMRQTRALKKALADGHDAIFVRIPPTELDREIAVLVKGILKRRPK